MSINWLKQLFIPFTFMALVGCGASDHTDDTNKDKENQKAPAPTGLTDQDLEEGSWYVACEPNQETGVSSDQLVLKVDRAYFRMGNARYGKADCSQVQFEFFVNFKAEVYAASKAHPDRRRIDLTPQNRSLVPLDSRFVAQLNQYGYCGIKDWAVGVERIVSANMPDCIEKSKKPDARLTGWFAFKDKTAKIYDSEADPEPQFIATKR